MKILPVRRLLIDLQTPFTRDWNGGDAFRSAFFNALSMSFPAGEQFFGQYPGNTSPVHLFEIPAA